MALHVELELMNKQDKKMSKITKQEIKKHEQALKLLEKDVLKLDDKFFILENYRADAVNMVSKVGAFFTPFGLGRDFAIECNHHGKTIDLCAGIGMLSFHVADYSDGEGFTCVEINPEYLEIGKKILPKANWILADVLSDEITSLSGFDLAISNPPFGNISGVGNFEYAVIETAGKIAKRGVYILPQMSTPFKYSGNPAGMEHLESSKYKRFTKKTGIEFEFNCGFDTAVYLKEWHGVSPLCEIVLVDYPEKEEDQQQFVFDWGENYKREGMRERL